jgi:hypothetical protein
MTTHVQEVIRGWLGWCPHAELADNPAQRDTAGCPAPGADARERPPAADPMVTRSLENYHNTQVGIIFTLARVIGVIGTILDILANGITGFRSFSALILLPITALLLTSTTLTVIVSDRHVKVYHGPLAFRKTTIPLTGIVSVRVEKDARHTMNRAVWYFSPKRFTLERGVVIEQERGKTFWIGTDEPDVLVKAILTAKRGSNVHY